ncbi:ribosome silencing factor [Clostridium aminobutyricum]|uniref:Ribosomal silencing factor RsfS n=1 Tax=Clostridium aminobutyricum TaxID=33953 RepID=A0A939D7E2_CLOAM|nr:ribosome silencing factor [Clostridium aminobutyricum]MBN7772445.1 ribosome silencing factor [Clostridium aminobutyricum]
MNNSKEAALLAVKVLDNKKAQDIVVIDISVKSSFADYFVLASGSSERQISALRDDIDEEFAKANIALKGIEGQPSSGWILMDFGDVIVNLLTVEMRQRYNIEKVWGDCEFLELDLED